MYTVLAKKTPARKKLAAAAALPARQYWPHAASSPLGFPGSQLVGRPPDWPLAREGYRPLVLAASVDSSAPHPTPSHPTPARRGAQADRNAPLQDAAYPLHV